MVPVQLVVVQVQLISASHAVDVVLALQGVSVPVQPVLDQLQTSLASHVVCEVKVEHGWGVPVQLLPLQLHPAAVQKVDEPKLVHEVNWLPVQVPRGVQPGQ
jgi:hypothetical protein